EKIVNLKKNSKIKSILSDFNSVNNVKAEGIDNEWLRKYLLECIKFEKSKYKDEYDSLENINGIKNAVELETVKRLDESMISTVSMDDYTSLVEKCFDFEFDGKSKFHPFEKPTKIPDDFSIGVIVGASGTGKSTLLN